MQSKTLPRYCRQREKKGPDRAFVAIDGQRIHLGSFGTRESQQEYARVLAEAQVSGGKLPAAGPATTINQILAPHWRHVEAYYVQDEKPTTEVESIRQALRPLVRLYGRLPAAEFSPMKLKAVRAAMVDAGWCRGTVNRAVQRIKQVFKWGVENELVPPSVYHGLTAVTGLRKGRCGVRESKPVQPVPDEYVDAIRPHVSRGVWAMIELQRLTGMRAGEVTAMRGCDLDTMGKVWLYKPRLHKNAFREHERVVELGPRAKATIKPFLQANTEAYLFSPQRAEVERYANAETHRRPNQRPKTPQTDRTLGERYTTQSYGRAIARACDVADLAAKMERGLERDSERIVPHWHSHQLRHNYGTMIRREYGLETARILLGHRSVPMTELYAEVDRAKAREVVGRIG